MAYPAFSATMDKFNADQPSNFWVIARLPVGNRVMVYPVMSTVFLSVTRAMLICKDALLAARMIQRKEYKVLARAAGYWEILNVWLLGVYMNDEHREEITT